LLVAYAIVNWHLNWTAIFFPLLIAPLVLVTMGITWIVSSLAVYVRDIGQTTGIITTIMLFLSPVFFPSSAIPEPYRDLLQVNPLTFIIEQSRDVLIWGNMPDWIGLAFYSVLSVVVAWLGLFRF